MANGDNLTARLCTMCNIDPIIITNQCSWELAASMLGPVTVLGEIFIYNSTPGEDIVRPILMTEFGSDTEVGGLIIDCGTVEWRATTMTILSRYLCTHHLQ